MKSKILVVEDNPKILHNVRLLLKFNDYEVSTAPDGLEALRILSETDFLPDLILCDISMPRMGGYDFFQKVSENPTWTQIPFIFITAKTSPEDVRFGKKLGVDDYVTKPFNKEDLLASIAGKIKRGKRMKIVAKRIKNELLKSLQIDLLPSVSQDKKQSICFFWTVWDEIAGPTVKTIYPKRMLLPFSLETLGTQLFQTTVSVYGQFDYFEAQGVLLRIANIRMDGYLYFDTKADLRVRGGSRQFMLVILAPNINYLESVRIKEIFEQLATEIKEDQEWDEKDYWEKITEILSTPMMSAT